MSRQNPTPRKLDAGQELAAVALIGGSSTVEAAEAAGVTRQTVSVWRNHDPAFIAYSNKLRVERNAELVDRLRELDLAALDRVAQKVEEGDFPASLAWLKMRGAAAAEPLDVGSIEPSEVLNLKAEALRRRPENMNEHDDVAVLLGSVMSLDEAAECVLTDLDERTEECN